MVAQTAEQMAIRMCEGNPGAIKVLAILIKDGYLECLVFLDELEIYGSAIYVLWNDVCKRSTADFVTIILGCRLGFVFREQLILASIDPCSAKFDLIWIQDRVSTFLEI